MPTPPNEMPDVQLDTIPRTFSPTVEAHVSPEDFGAGLGQAAEGLAGAMADRMNQRTLMMNQAANLEADNHASQIETQLLHDPKTGILNQELGNNAPEAVDKTLKDYQDAAGKIRAGLSNGAQQEAFDRMYGNRLGAVQRTLFQYEHGQMTKYASEQFDASEKQTHIDAVNQSYDGRGQFDAASVNEHRAKLTALIQDRGQTLAMPPEAIKLQTENAQSDLTVGVLDRMLSERRDQDAEKFFNENQADIIDPRQRASLQLAVNHIVTQNGAQRRVMAAAFDEHGLTRSRGEALGILNKDTWVTGDAEHQRQSYEQLNTVLGEQHQAKTEAENTAFSDAFQQLRQGNWDIKAINPMLMSQMDPEQVEHLMGYAKKGGGEHDQGKYMGLYQDATSDKPEAVEAFKKVDLRQYVGQISDAKLDDLMKMQGELRKGKPGPVTVAAHQLNEIATDTFKENMLPTGEKAKPEEQAALAKFLDIYQEQIDGEDAALDMQGKPRLNTEQRKERARHLMLPDPSDPKRKRYETRYDARAAAPSGPVAEEDELKQTQTILARPENAETFNAKMWDIEKMVENKSDPDMQKRAEQLYGSALTTLTASGVPFEQRFTESYQAHHNDAMPSEIETLEAFRVWRINEAQKPGAVAYREAQSRIQAAQVSEPEKPVITPEAIRQRWEGAGIKMRPEAADALATIFDLPPDAFAWAKDFLLKKRF